MHARESPTPETPPKVNSISLNVFPPVSQFAHLHATNCCTDHRKGAISSDYSKGWRESYEEKNIELYKYITKRGGEVASSSIFIFFHPHAYFPSPLFLPSFFIFRTPSIKRGCTRSPSYFSLISLGFLIRPIFHRRTVCISWSLAC